MSKLKMQYYEFYLWSVTFDSAVMISVFASSLSDAERQLSFFFGDVLASHCEFQQVSDK